MNIVIEIKDDSVLNKSGTSARTGKPYSINFQQGFVEINGERRLVNINVEDGQAPHKPGKYTVSDQSFYVDGYSSLKIGRLVLTAVAPAKVA